MQLTVRSRIMTPVLGLTFFLLLAAWGNRGAWAQAARSGSRAPAQNPGPRPAAPAAASDTEFHGEIRTGALFKIGLEVRDWLYVETQARALENGEACEQVLVRDLTNSDFFDVHRESFSLASAADSTAHTRPARAVASGEVHRQMGRVVLEASLTDAATSKVIFHKTYPLGDPPSRWAIHAYADDITLYLTGERGVAQTRIAYVGDATGSKEIYLVDSDGADLQMVTNFRSISVSPRWSPTGDRLAFTTFSHGPPQLIGLRLQDDKLWTISARQGMNSAPCWAPDGTHLLASLSYQGNSEIYLLDSGGGNPRRLTSDAGIDTAPSLNPSGSQIAFTSDRSGEPQVYVMDADGTNLHRLTYVSKHCDSPDWSPKGDRILFVALIDPVFDICSIRPDGSDLRRLTDGGTDHENPRWAPDGRHIVFAMWQGNDRHLFIMAADGSGIRQLTWSHGNQYNPAWSPPLPSTGN